jgi:hypothetical protein
MWFKVKQFFYPKEPVEVNVEPQRDRSSIITSVCKNKGRLLQHRKKRRMKKTFSLMDASALINIEYYEVKCCLRVWNPC